MLNLFNFIRRMSTEEKKKIQAGLTNLSPEDLDEALKVVAQDNPSFRPTTVEVDLDMDSLVRTHKLILS